MGLNLAVDEDSDEFGDFDDSDLIAAEKESRKRPFEINEDDIPSSAKRVKSSVEDASITIPRDILRKIWGFPDFRLQQAEAISRLVAGKNAVVIFPTGGGKSLVYQIPALAFDEFDEYLDQEKGGGVTLVVSPLIALMKVWIICCRALMLLMRTGPSGRTEETRCCRGSHGFFAVTGVVVGYNGEVEEWELEATVSSL